jgi:hypothetical protein
VVLGWGAPPPRCGKLGWWDQNPTKKQKCEEE